jgi:hypothetical protein
MVSIIEKVITAFSVTILDTVWNSASTIVCVAEKNFLEQSNSIFKDRFPLYPFKSEIIIDGDSDNIKSMFIVSFVRSLKY